MTKKSSSTYSGGFDVALVLAVATLLAVGLIMVYSTTYALGFRLYANPNFFLVRQGMWVVVGVAALLVMTRVRYTGWQRISVLVMAGMLLLLAALLIFGGERFGGRRWFFGGSVQPSELAKLAVVIYIADWLSSKGEQIRDVTYGLIPFAILIGVVTGLILLQPDFSTSMLIATTALAYVFRGRRRGEAACHQFSGRWSGPGNPDLAGAVSP